MPDATGQWGRGKGEVLEAQGSAIVGVGTKGEGSTGTGASCGVSGKSGWAQAAPYFGGTCDIHAYTHLFVSTSAPEVHHARHPLAKPPPPFLQPPRSTNTASQ